jgi:hypothetical protein
VQAREEVLEVEEPKNERTASPVGLRPREELKNRETEELKNIEEVPVVPDTPETPAASEPPKTSNADISLDEVKKRWNEVFELVAKNNGSLPLILQSTEILEFDQGVLRLGFQFSFHADMINDQKNNIKISEAASEIFGGKVIIEAVHRVSEKDEVVADLVAEFGGKVVS